MKFSTLFDVFHLVHFAGRLASGDIGGVMLLDLFLKSLSSANIIFVYIINISCHVCNKKKLWSIVKINVSCFQKSNQDSSADLCT